MNKTQVLKRTLIAIMGLAAWVQPLSAEHATAFLEPLQTEVSERIAELTDESTAAERKALTAAEKILNRNSSSVAGDLGLLGKVSMALDRAYAEDEELAALQDDVLLDFLAEAQAAFDDAAARVAGLTGKSANAAQKQLDQAGAALERAADDTNTLKERARAIVFALNKTRVATLIATRGEKAPLSVDGRSIILSFDGGGRLTLESDGSYILPTEEGDETGTWAYGQTSGTTAELTLVPDGGGAAHIAELTFRSRNNGTFAGVAGTGEEISGRFQLR